MDGILSTDVDIKAGIRCKDIKIKKPVSTSDLTEMPSSGAVTPVGVQFRLRDINKDLVAAWRAEFKDHENVQVCSCPGLNCVKERKIASVLFLVRYLTNLMIKDLFKNFDFWKIF